VDVDACHRYALCATRNGLRTIKAIVPTLAYHATRKRAIVPTLAYHAVRKYSNFSTIQTIDANNNTKSMGCTVTPCFCLLASAFWLLSSDFCLLTSDFWPIGSRA